ncbi:AraC family transcriptional regulator [Lentzea sp. JNUCC 0626]|uniref:AraC family transcriptional regulator n=1 Tax=Lentzea sp. JNUCC 0626 TaxID=3367513 RepID=UPI003747D458
MRSGHTPLAAMLVTAAGYWPDAAGQSGRGSAGSADAFVLVCIDGEGEVVVGDRCHAIGLGQVVVVPPEVAYEHRADHGNPWTILWVHLSGNGAAGMMRLIAPRSRERVLVAPDPAAVVGPLASVVAKLDAGWAVDDLTAASARGWLLLSRLFEIAEEHAVYPEPVGRVVGYLQATFMQPLRLDVLARLAKAPADLLSRDFRAATGLDIAEYVTELRMSLARDLLLSTSHPVGVIAHRTGHADVGYFIRKFRLTHGCGPIEFRL